MNNNSLIQINEFCRELIPNQINGRWVSTGYQNEIGCPYPNVVPDVIKKFVEAGLFRIEDAYGDHLANNYALIAREVEQYSVLAVATKLIEDGSRPGVSYRYFWLDKLNNLNIDGILTLLFWWKSQSEPKYEIDKQGKFLQPEQYRSDIICKDHLKNNSKEIETYDCEYFPYLLDPDRNINKYLIFHHLAFSLHKNHQYNQPIAWAFNVSLLAKPNSFTLIQCISKQNYEYLLSRIDNSNNSYPPSAQRPKEYNHYSQSDETKHSLNISQRKNEFSELIFIAKKKSLQKEDIELLLRYNNKPFNENYIDQVFLNFASEVSDAAQYYALLAFIYPSEYFGEWLDWLLFNYYNCKYCNISLEFHNLLYNGFFKYYKTNQKISDIDIAFYREISNILFNLSYSKESQQNKHNLQKSITSLLSKSERWSKSFKEYSSNLAKYLTRLEYNIQENLEENLEDKFTKHLKNDLLNYNVNVIKKNCNLKYLAELFKELKKYSLSGLFFQLSQNSVPYDVYSNVETEWIDLNTGKEETRKSSRFINHLNIFVLFLIILGMGFVTQGWHKYFFTFLTSLAHSQNNNQENNIDSKLTIDDVWQIFMNAKDEIVIENKKQEIIALLEKPNRDTESWLKQNFIPDLSIEKPNKLPVDKDSYLDDIKLIQSQLKLANDQVKIDGEWENLEKAIDDFQKKNNLRTDKIMMGKTTFDKLNEYLKQEKSIEVVKKFILNTLKTKTKTYEEVKTAIEYLKFCREKEEVYIDKFIICIQEWQKES